MTAGRKPLPPWPPKPAEPTYLEDPPGPARGVFHGVVLGLLVWILLAALAGDAYALVEIFS